MKRSLWLPKQPWALWGMVAALANAALRVLLVPLLVTPLVDEVLNQADLSALGNLLTLGAALIVAGALALFAQDALLGMAAARLTATWRAQLLDSLLRRRPGSLPGSSGGLSSRILTDLKDIETYYQFGLGTLVAETATALGIVAVLLYLNPLATLLLVGLCLPLVWVLGGLGKRIERQTQEAQGGLESLGDALQESFKHHSVLRAFRALDFASKRFAKLNERTEASLRRRNVLSALATPITQLAVFVVLAALLLLLTRSVSAGVMSAGELVTYLGLTALLATPSQLLPKGYALYKQAEAATRRLEHLLETAPNEKTAEMMESQSSNGIKLELNNLSFHYPDGEPVLKNLNLVFPERGLVALTGESGAGKSTLLSLLLGFLEPSAGNLRLAGRSLANWHDADLRRAIAYVPQNTDLLRGSLRENLCLGRELEGEALWRALASVQLRELVEGLPNGLEHRLGEDGLGLSGGQKQRLAVARALLGEPAILLLDEPSANLDTESERILVQTLTQQAETRLVVVVAHRAALIRAADHVFELQSGHLKERDS